jgi:hypothetical protein
LKNRSKKFVLIFFFILGIQQIVAQKKINDTLSFNKIIDQWHLDASSAQLIPYFELMTDDFVFLGTAPGERWTKSEFYSFCKPYFDKGKAWTFHPIQRNIYLDNNSKFAWFDELLDSSFKICRGSGIIENVNGEWKVKHYVLSMTIPNDKSNQVVAIKDSLESILIMELKQTKKKFLN